MRRGTLADHTWAEEQADCRQPLCPSVARTLHRWWLTEEQVLVEGIKLGQRGAEAEHGHCHCRSTPRHTGSPTTTVLVLP